MLIQLKGLQVTNFSDESFVETEGCETCDYGRIVATHFTISFSDGNHTTIYMKHDSPISMSLLIKFFVNTDFSEMSKKQFLNKLCNFLKREHKGYENFELSK